MSSHFRPVQEIWGVSSSMFLEHDAMISFLEDLAERANTTSSKQDYGDVTTVFFPDGNAIFDYVENSPEFTAASFIDSMPGDSESEKMFENLENVITNFNAYAAEWRKSIGKDGSLRFYVD